MPPGEVSAPPVSALEPAARLHPDRPTLLPLPPEEPLDLAHTFRCGQVFRWQQHGESWYGPYGAASLALRRTSDGVEVRARGAAVSVGEVERFLGLDHSLAALYGRLRWDGPVRAAMDALPGLRILRQDPWECLATYICSQWNNIPKIELTTGRIGSAWGQVHQWEDGIEVASFPSPEALARVPLEELQSCALGYRCRYLIDTARRVSGREIDLPALRGAPYDEALRALLSLPGIGRKVADCILLFSLDQPQACPVDVWVRRIVHELYAAELEAYLPDLRERAEKGLSGREYEAITRFVRDRWGMDAGYAQQYLFYARRLGLLGEAPTGGDALPPA